MRTTITQSLNRNPSPSPEPASPARQHIERVTSQVSDPQPFVRRLASVNENLSSHGNGSLPMEHALEYEQLVEKVTKGKISNSGAHAYSTVMWARKFAQDGKPSSAVGAIFNGIGGTLASGAHDHSLQKTGQTLREK